VRDPADLCQIAHRVVAGLSMPRIGAGIPAGPSKSLSCCCIFRPTGGWPSTVSVAIHGRSGSQFLVNLRRWRTIPAGGREGVSISDVATGPGDEFLGAAHLSCGGLSKGPDQQIACHYGRDREHEPEDEQPAAERAHEVP
jgi:hypothetical protein